MDDGDALRMSRQYVQQGIRNIAEDLCTRQLGYRTQLDAAEAERREITEKRFTSLDRRMMRNASEIAFKNGQRYLAVVPNPIQVVSSETARLDARHEAARLAVLQRMGLAQLGDSGTWLIRRDFEQILRAMQRAADRQKTLAAHGALLSDERLPIEALDFSRKTAIEGRVLVHGQDGQSGRNYLMLESTDAKVYFIRYMPEIEEARRRGELRVNSFVRLHNLSADGAALMDVQDLGDADRLLGQPHHFSRAAKKLLNQEIMPTNNGWGGWLGRYQAALVKSANEIAHHAEERLVRERERERQQDRSLGR